MYSKPYHSQKIILCLALVVLPPKQHFSVVISKSFIQNPINGHIQKAHCHPSLKLETTPKKIPGKLLNGTWCPGFWRESSSHWGATKGPLVNASCVFIEFIIFWEGEKKSNIPSFNAKKPAHFNKNFLTRSFPPPPFFLILRRFCWAAWIQRMSTE